jgi:hypothetical protein
MQKAGAILISLTALAGILFFLFLFLAVRCEEDDMILSLDLRANGLLYLLESRYFFSSFRTTLLLIDGLILAGQDPGVYAYTIFAFYAFVFIFLASVLYRLAEEIFQVRPAALREKILLSAICITQVMAIYFLCSSRAEVFGWLCASAVHLVPVVFAAWASRLLFKAAPKRTDKPLLFLTACVIAGGAEHISVLALVLGLVVLVAGAAGYFKITQPQRSRLLFFVISLGVIFTLVITNPGAWRRVADVNDMLSTGVPEQPAILLLFFQPYKLIGMLLAAGGIACLRFYFNPPPVRTRPFTWGVAGILVLTVCVAMSLAAYRRYGPGRIWFPFDLFTYALLSILFFRFFSGRSALRVAAVSLACMASAAWYAYRHMPALWQYRKSFDSVARRVANAAPGEVVSITDFPSPDLVSSVELSADPQQEANQLFCRFYNSPAKVSVSDRK